LPYPKQNSYRLSRDQLAQTLKLESKYWTRIRNIAEENQMVLNS
jgi:predicted DNA-binding ribbon-helix-helix protein